MCIAYEELSWSSLFLLQVVVVATDTGGLSSSATAVITVNRNLNNPAWVRTVYETTIDENYPLYTQILQLTATDLDTQAPHNTLSFSVSGFNSASNYFEISSTGILTLRNTLVGTSVDAFQVHSFVPCMLKLYGYNYIKFSKSEVVTTVSAQLNVIIRQMCLKVTELLLLEIVFFFHIELLRLHCDTMDCLYIQFDVTLRDLGQPVSRSTNEVATVTVNVNRNEFAPIFFNSTYYADILETQAVGSGVVTVTAQDQDTSV